MAVAARPRPDLETLAADGRGICELSAHLQAGTAELALRLAAFDAGGGWGGAGIRSLPHWLSIQAGLDLSTSADLLRIGQGLSDLPLIRQAATSGQLSLDKVRALLRVATPADEAVWLELALGADASQLTRICRECRRSMDADAPGQTDELMARRGLWTRHQENGMLRLVALLPPEDGAAVVAALEAVARGDAGARRQREGKGEVDGGAASAERAHEPWAARRADALRAVCDHAMAAGPEGLVSNPDAVRMVVHVDVGVLTGEQPDGRCHLDDGTPLATSVARRLGCDAEVVAITERDGLPIDVGRRRRLFTGRQRRALQVRDRTCRYPGCPVSSQRARGHHLVDWWRGGRTDLANGLCICDPHHTALHEGEFRIVKQADGELRFETPDGVAIEPPRREPLDPGTGGGAHLRERHGERGLAIGPETALAGWGGERGDLHYVADVNLEAAARARALARAGPDPPP